MLGKIVELDNEKDLFVIVKENNYEDMGSCQYERDFWLVPYQPELDDMQVELDKAKVLKVRATRFPFTVREDKKTYTQYGTSDIRGVKKVYFERIWEEIIVPGR
ncbi:hypothetical protein CVD28_00350 [Bacillus sp. M6-12]|uniref:hypothetical protein n=1 Tax=Bacillus sp. M6-12 TaxID=2054166 RepID=UPI000C77700C|nr:hypothetical protein [Bacillus sp. M6-12]PLS18886.1 hypothetical protein CVD28_00350 [Bacillus sp. M6-12]